MQVPHGGRFHRIAVQFVLKMKYLIFGRYILINPDLQNYSLNSDCGGNKNSIPAESATF
jgi:hypothetical protein